MKLRRIFSLLIAAALIVSMLPLGAIATDHEELISEAVAAPLGEGGGDPEGAPQPEETIEIPEGEPEGGDGLPSDVIGNPEDKQGETPEEPGTGDPGTGDPGTGDPGAGDLNPGETPEDPGTGDPAEGEDPEQPKEGEDPGAGEEGEEPAEEPVDVTTLFGEELARYFEELEAKEDYDALDALVDILTEEQIQSLVGIETTSWTIADLMRIPEAEEEKIEYYPASTGPVGPIIRGNNGFRQAGLDTGMQAAGRMIAGVTAFGAGLLSAPTLPDFETPEEGMTVSKTATPIEYSETPGLTDRQYFKLDLGVTVAEGEEITVDVPADIVLVLDVSGSMGYTLSTYYTYTAITPGKNDNGPYYIDLDPGPGEIWEVVRRQKHDTGNDKYWCYGDHSKDSRGIWRCTRVDSLAGGTGSGGNYQFYNRVLVTITRLQALKDAVNTFLTSVLEKSPQSRVAIVTYADSSSIRTGTMENALLSIKGTDGNLNSGLTSVVNSLIANGGTRADRGFENATKILQNKIIQDGADAVNRNRVVIHFTDGEPGDNGFDDSWNDYVGEKTAADVIRWAKILKNDLNQPTDVNTISFSDYSGDDFPQGHTHSLAGCKATVYSVGIFTSPKEKTHQYMWRSSSNTKFGSTNDNYTPDTPSMDDGVSHYYMTADSADSLKNIFEQISQQIGMVFENAKVRDYISPEFELCDEYGNKIDITGLSVTNSITMGAYTIKIDQYDRIYVEWSVAKIDYENPFNGMIYVKPKDDFIGGNNLLTNIENISAVYSGETILASFPKPRVNVPFKLGTGAYADDIYLGDTIDETMVSTAEIEMLADIFRGYDYSTIGTVTPSWTTNPTGLKPTASTNAYGYSVTVTPKQADGSNDDANHILASVGRAATETTATGTYTVNVFGATLTAQGFTILKGQTAVLSSAAKTLTWTLIPGKTPPAASEISYTVYYGSNPVASDPQLTENRTFTVTAFRNGVPVASAGFTVDVVCPTFTDASYNILLGESVGNRYTVGSNLGVGINYSGTGGLQYSAGELTYVPNYSGYGSPFASHVPSATGTYTVPVTVQYGNTSIVIGSAKVTINVSVPTFTGKTFHLLKGEQASADGYNAPSDGITVDYTGVPSGLTYPSLTYTLASGSTLPDSRPGADAVNKINVFYNGNPIAQNVEVSFKVHAPTFAGNTFDLFYGETVKGAYPSVTTAAGAITITQPALWPSDRADRWTTYKAKITAEAAAEYANALDTVYPPGNPNPAAQFPVTMTYVDGTFSAPLTTETSAPKITINVTPGSLTIIKSVTNTGNKGVLDPDQTFLFKITRKDGQITEVFYEYITGSGTKTITGLKKGVYTVTEMTDWSWRYALTNGNNKKVYLGQDANGTRNLTAILGSTSFTNNKTTDSWLSDEATPKANDCGTVPAPGTQSAKTEAAILPGKRNGLPEAGSAEQA